LSALRRPAGPTRFPYTTLFRSQSINQYYGGSHTLRGVSLSLERGQCLALLGRNGVGKTTLLKCLMGVEPVASGRIQFNGQDITQIGRASCRERVERPGDAGS